MEEDRMTHSFEGAAGKLFREKWKPNSV